jgi:hypothetical protein
MAAMSDTTVRVMAGIAALGVPWWGWAALVMMMFLGLLVPGFTDGEPQELAPGGPTR